MNALSLRNALALVWSLVLFALVFALLFPMLQRPSVPLLPPVQATPALPTYLATLPGVSKVDVGYVDGYKRICVSLRDEPWSFCKPDASWVRTLRVWERADRAWDSPEVIRALLLL